MNKIFRQTLCLLSVAAAVSLTSCDSLTHDETTDCPEGMVIQLVPKYAARTSFESELTDVHIFIYNESDALVKELDVNGDQLSQQDYQVSVTMPEGKYHLVVWNGLSDTDNYDEQNQAVSLKTASDNSTSNTFMPLWHGEVTDATVLSLNMTKVIVPMVKDTNNFVIHLCTTNGDVLNADDFDFKITSANGSMARNNDVLTGPTITYNYFSLKDEDIEGSLDEDLAQPDELGMLHMLRSDINTLRLTTEHPSYLYISNKKTGKNVLALNLNDYILKAFRSINASQNVSDQQYFDTEDLFNITLFLTPRAEIVDEPVYYLAVIKINAWILRVQDAELMN
jgi:hypothetical protein